MYPYLLIKKKGKRMKEKAVGLWNRIATKENKQIAKNVLLILLVSRLFIYLLAVLPIQHLAIILHLLRCFLVAMQIGILRLLKRI